ncbi:MAG TPA: aliphatic sulfonate ABC transporter substrate-binding protein [Beijerinckia sp.]|jgi:sulfonate transport system substrate-binding protein|nr:aliphatic sulfonate ABC transporter substrate-binding protein [Beijerinckia sp.]
MLAIPPALATSCGQKAKGAERKLRFSYQRSSTLLTILKTNGALEKKLAPLGYEVSWHLFANVIDPMNAGAVDFHADVADAVPIFTQSAGAKLTLYAKEDPSPTAEAIIVPDESSIRTIADLKGKRIGVDKGSGCHFLLVAALKREGLTFKDIIPAYLPAADGAAAFKRGAIDAWVIWDPFLAITQTQAKVRIVADGTGFTSYYRYYTVNDEIVASRPELVQLVFDLLVETGQWVRGNREEAAKILAPIWGDVPLTTIEAVNQRRSYSVRGIEKSALGEQQAIADTFFEAGLIPARLVTADARIWTPAKG